MKFLKVLTNLIIILFLTVTTQIGGLLYLISLIIYKQKIKFRLAGFVLLYLFCTFFIVPYVAPVFGRERIKTGKTIKMHMLLTTLTNRNYVVPEVNNVLDNVVTEVRETFPSLEIHCLDANFPFINGFPLLPHLSHKDGKKLDISLIYQNKVGKVVNLKPSRSGYGVFEEPKDNEFDQIAVCKNNEYWQYDFPKYLTLGTTNDEIDFSEVATKQLLKQILSQSSISKVFIEPHLRERMDIKHVKLRYHGCRAVRHDDHIHLQVK